LVRDLDLCVPLADEFQDNQSAYALCSFYAYVQGFRLFYQVKASSIVFFSAEGPVEFRPDSYELDSCLRAEPTAWALFDSTASFKEPPDTFLTKKDFIIQTPSPH
jgi:hypothetical protein